MPINRRPGPDEHPHERPGQCPPTPAPGQGPRGPDGLPRADRPSIRVAMAASLLRHGRDPVRVAERTQVPLALVELLAEHAGGDRHCVRPRRSAGCQSSIFEPDSPQPSGGSAWQYVEMSRPWATARRPIRSRSHGWPLTAILPIVMNLGLALTCMASHRPVLGAISLLVTAPLFVSVVFALR
jgi:hypothetical protein